MTTHITRSIEEKTRNRIAQVIRGVAQLSNTNVHISADRTSILVHSDWEFLPDFEFSWCHEKQHYRVYIMTATEKEIKSRRGYAICVVGNIIAAAGFITLYSFIHRFRANNKS